MCSAFPLLLSLPSQCNNEGLLASETAMKGCNKKGQEGWWDKVSDELAHQPLLPLDMCYLGIAQGDPSPWLQTQKGFQCTICYLAPVTCTNKPIRGRCHYHRHLGPSLCRWVTKAQPQAGMGEYLRWDKAGERPLCSRFFTCFASVAVTNVAKCTWL